MPFCWLHLCWLLNFPRRHDWQPGSVVFCFEDGQRTIRFNVSVRDFSKVFNSVLSQLLKKLIPAEGIAFQKFSTDHSVADRFLRNSVDRPFCGCAIGNQDIETLVGHYDHRDHQKGVKQGHVRIEHGIANGRPERNDQKEFNCRQLPDCTTAKPSQQHQGVAINNGGSERYFQQKERRLFAEKHAFPIKDVNCLIHWKLPALNVLSRARFLRRRCRPGTHE